MSHLEVGYSAVAVSLLHKRAEERKGERRQERRDRGEGGRKQSGTEI